MEAPTQEQKKKTYEQLAFIHSIVTQRTQFFVDEFKVAEASARMLTDMANRLADEIKAAEPVAEPVKEEQGSSDQAQ
jgi:hypothetical protein